MTLGILTCTTKNRAPLYKLTNITKMKFASSRLDVQYVFSNSFSENIDWGLFWLKPQFMLKHISKFDYILWMDDDAGIVDQTFNVEQFLNSLNPSKSIFLAKDENGLNAGVILMKNDEISKECLQYQISKAPLPEYQKLYYDQSVLVDFVERHKDSFQELPGSIFNAHHEGIEFEVPNKYCDFTFIVHVAGGDGRKIQLSRRPGGLEEVYKVNQCLE